MSRPLPEELALAELERLLALLGDRRRPGFIDLPEPDGAEPADADGEFLDRTESPSLPPTGSDNQGAQAAIPAKPAPADPGTRPDKPKPVDPAGNKPHRHRRPPDRKFY